MRTISLIVCLLALGCSVTVGPAGPVKPNVIHADTVTVTLADVTAAIAKRVPERIEDSDFLILVLDDQVSCGDLTRAQADLIIASLPGIKEKLRKLTVEDAATIRLVK